MPQLHVHFVSSNQHYSEGQAAPAPLVLRVEGIENRREKRPETLELRRRQHRHRNVGIPQSAGLHFPCLNFLRAHGWKVTMGFNISTTKVSDIAIARCVGRITVNDGSVKLREFASEIVNAGTAKLILDLSETIYIDSSGMGELASAATIYHNRGGNLVVSNLSVKLTELFHVTKWDTFIKVFPDVTDAVAFFEPIIP